MCRFVLDVVPLCHSVRGPAGVSVCPVFTETGGTSVWSFYIWTILRCVFSSSLFINHETFESSVFFTFAFHFFVLQLKKETKWKTSLYRINGWYTFFTYIFSSFSKNTDKYLSTLCYFFFHHHPCCNVQRALAFFHKRPGSPILTCQGWTNNKQQNRHDVGVFSH